MEVHHHPEIGKKNFKEYLLEGLMIFLAVTMGFFAESLRENMNVKEKEASYIRSLINNLNQDTEYLNTAIDINQRKIKGLDTVLSLSSCDMTKPSDRRLLYRCFGKYISLYSGFTANDATMMQLKNSGGMQYIRRHHIADSISAYDLAMRNIYAAEVLYSKSINDAVDATGELLIFTTKTSSDTFSNGDQSDKQYLLLTNDPQKKGIFFNKIYLEQGWTLNYVNNLKEGLPFTKRLIGLLKKEYDLD